MQNMQQTKHNWPILSVSLFISAIILIGVIFFQLTEGEPFEADGLRQNTRIYLDNITVDVENEAICYTLHNNTNHEIAYAPQEFRMAIKRDGTWVSLYKSQYYSRTSFPDPSLPAFSKRDMRHLCLEDEYDVPQEPGEYRILVPCYDGEDRLSAVGYFTIP